MDTIRITPFTDFPETPLPAEIGTVLRRFTGGEQLTVARITFAAGSMLPGHRHANEQFTVILAGSLDFIAEDGAIRTASAGDVVHLPGNVWHAARAVTDATVLDVFAPPRADWGAPPEPTP